MQAVNSDDDFWKFALNWPRSPNTQSENCTSTIRRRATQDMSVNMRHLFDLAVSTRQFSAKVEMFMQIALESIPKPGSCCWTVIEGKTYVDPAGLPWPSSQSDEILPFDHAYTNSENASAILYAPIGSHCSTLFHRAFVDKHLNYIWRPVLIKGCTDFGSCGTFGIDMAVALAGYGVQLAIKNTEYNARDDSLTDIVINESEQKEEYVFNLVQVQDLGLAAAEHVLQSSNPLRSLQDLAQNFPSHVNSLKPLKVNNEVVKAVQLLQRRISSSHLLLINGMSMDLSNLNFYDLLEFVRNEATIFDTVIDTGISSSSIKEVMSLGPSMEAAEQPARIDLRPTESSIVFWNNDLETDQKSQRWPKSLRMLLQPMFPGQLPRVARNILNAVFVFDPSSADAFDIAKAIRVVDTQLQIVRFGFIPIQSGELSSDRKLFNRLFISILQEMGPSWGIDFLSRCERSYTGDGSFLELGEEVFKEVYQEYYEDLEDDNERVLTERALKNALAIDNSDVLTRTTNYAQRMGLYVTGSVLVFNGMVVPYSPQGWTGSLIKTLQSELGILQEAVYLEQLTDGIEDVYGAILDMSPNLLPRYNPKFFPPPKGRGIKLPTMSEGNAGNERFVQLSLRNLSEVPIYYLQSSNCSCVPVTHLLVVDGHQNSSLHHLLAALQAPDSTLSRLGILMVVNDVDKLSTLEKAVLAFSAGFFDSASRADVIDLILGVQDSNSLLDASWLPGSLVTIPSVIREEDVKLKIVAKAVKDFAENALGLPAGTQAIVTNGRIVTLDDLDEVSPYDFALLDVYGQERMLASSLNDVMMKETGLSQKVASDIASVISSSLVVARSDKAELPGKSLAAMLDEVKSWPNTVVSKGSEPAPLNIHVILDPISKTAQEVASILLMLNEALGAQITLTLSPTMNLTQVPLQSFYRYVVPSAAENDLQPLHATFSGLPIHQVLTLGLDVPESWLVEAVAAEQDMDNLHLDEIGGYSAEARFELEALLAFGSCIDMTSFKKGSQGGIHPRGLQVQLGKRKEPHIVDTLVMSNLGYFQLKASPGLWNLRLAPGRSKELFAIEASTGTTGGSNLHDDSTLMAENDHIPLAVATLSGKHMHLFVKKDIGRFDEDVLEETPQGGILKWKSSLPALRDDRIHVFTVASGHMYERLQKIMILSVIKRTKSRVKFWFIKNYMSPQMKAFVPYMARQYEFDYEFITYKWPSWLFKQTEKQRIIWAYKILFLDVLFPLNLKKVIFCDSDQVVRADLKELWDLDLKGAPYGYTPFCDSNPDTEGFRFWKHGFWKDHLQGKRYHISALYVVDLERFRSMAAGDRLRVIYDNLARDPNSLSNLDQDLPNFAQQSGVPIYSLPQEWLWCETWCSRDEASRSAAKTIDLCNNPATKEPKLVAARRIIKEWPALAKEAEEFTERIKLYQDGSMSEDDLAQDSGRFVATLRPMVEGIISAYGDHEEL